MDEIFRKLFESNLADLAGLIAVASIPVSEQLINEVIAVAIRGNRNLRECTVFIHPQNRVSIILKTPLWPWRLELKLRLESLVDFSGPPRIKACLENKVLLARIGSFLKALPPRISLHRDQVAVELESFLSRPEQKKVLELIKSIEIETEEHKMILDVRIEVGAESHNPEKESQGE